MSYPKLFDYIDNFEQKIEISGVPQIDYKIQRDQLKKMNYPLIFRKQRRWQENRKLDEDEDYYCKIESSEEEYSTFS